MTESNQTGPQGGTGLSEVQADAARLAAIREVLAHFDWEFHDRQLALEEIERIAGAGTGSPPRELPAALSDAQREVLRQALGDAIAWATNDDWCHVCEQSPAGLCPDHQAELDRRDNYIKLSRELGIKVQS
jgi:hypothetical protein